MRWIVAVIIQVIILYKNQDMQYAVLNIIHLVYGKLKREGDKKIIPNIVALVNAAR
jgi:hypothetical protein